MKQLNLQSNNLNIFAVQNDSDGVQNQHKYLFEQVQKRKLDEQTRKLRYRQELLDSIEERNKKLQQLKEQNQQLNEQELKSFQQKHQQEQDLIRVKREQAIDCVNYSASAQKQKQEQQKQQREAERIEQEKLLRQLQEEEERKKNQFLTRRHKELADFKLTLDEQNQQRRLKLERARWEEIQSPSELYSPLNSKDETIRLKNYSYLRDFILPPTNKQVQKQFGEERDILAQKMITESIQAKVDSDRQQEMQRNERRQQLKSDTIQTLLQQIKQKQSNNQTELTEKIGQKYKIEEEMRRNELEQMQREYQEKQSKQSYGKQLQDQIEAERLRKSMIHETEGTKRKHQGSDDLKQYLGVSPYYEEQGRKQKQRYERSLEDHYRIRETGKMNNGNIFQNASQISLRNNIINI